MSTARVRGARLAEVAASAPPRAALFVRAMVVHVAPHGTARCRAGIRREVATMSHLKAAPLPVLAFTTRPAESMTELSEQSPKAKATAEHTPLMQQYLPPPRRSIRNAGVLPHGRLLRAVLRRRAQGRAPARHHADPARQFGRRADPDGRRARARARGLPGAAGGARRIGRDLRADRRPGAGQGPGASARWCASSRPGTVTDEALLERAPRHPAAGGLRAARPAMASPGPTWPAAASWSTKSRRRPTRCTPNSRGCEPAEAADARRRRPGRLPARARPACAGARPGTSTPTAAARQLLQFFGTHDLSGFGSRTSRWRSPPPARCCGYVQETQKAAPAAPDRASRVEIGRRARSP